jgi:hypothetical protein
MDETGRRKHVTDIQLPSGVDPDAEHTEFRANECKECGAAGPVALVSNPVWWQWGDKHTEETGHTKLYQWVLTRNIVRMVTLKTPAKKRRTLGPRGA